MAGGGKASPNRDEYELLQQTYFEPFEASKINIFPGLGNHDYQNRVNDCGGAMSPIIHSNLSRNHCAHRMITFLRDRVRNLNLRYPEINFHYDDSDNFGDSSSYKNISGSLAYSWDIGDNFHFVQLNNFPAYHFKTTFGFRVGVHSFDLDIHPSLDWLEADLARNRHKEVIINQHVMSSDCLAVDKFNKSTPGWIKFMGILDKYHSTVKAIFAGHIHQLVGHSIYSSTQNIRRNRIESCKYVTTPSGHKIPVFYSGSAEYNKYLRVDFSKHAIDVHSVDSVNGATKQYHEGSIFIEPVIAAKELGLESTGFRDGKLVSLNIDEQKAYNQWGGRDVNYKVWPGNQPCCEINHGSPVKVNSNKSQHSRVVKPVAGWWLPENNKSRWLDSPAIGTTTFETRFTVPEGLGIAMLKGRLSADNSVVMWVNGIRIPHVEIADFRTWTGFRLGISDTKWEIGACSKNKTPGKCGSPAFPLKPGMNIIKFEVHNFGGPGGLRVEFY